MWKTDEKIIAAEFRFLMDSGAVPYDEDVAFALDYLVHDFDDPTVNAALFMAWKEWKAPPAMDTADRGRNRDASLLAYIDKYRRFAIIIAEKGKNGNTG